MAIVFPTYISKARREYADVLLNQITTAAILDAEAKEVAGVYLRSAADISLEDLPLVDLQVENPNFPGRSFTGTIESVLWEIKALEAEGTSAEPSVVKREPSTSDLEPRQGAPVTCGWGEPVNRWNCEEGFRTLRGAGDNCCSWDCGMFLCNKLNVVWRVHCKSIANDVQAIDDKCRAFDYLSGLREFNNHWIGVRKSNC
ncbi:hypothetical protein B0T11DRAFT_350175 [Plectosphaerella cucumerina]|uniref:Uncharacterized protein n=1 Tax=Plectosphaerella cucumerina TaxID=40658 RepID=A0A8K0TPZ5_9PEZI|nr:hypothetical protein B0T11DRAFT_350175 [Plectosphaerella cucumerina]